MKTATCSQCGRNNDASAAACTECGSVLNSGKSGNEPSGGTLGKWKKRVYFHRLLIASQFAGSKIEVPSRKMLHNVLYIMGFAPYIALPFISGYLPIEFSLMVSVAITSLVTYAMSRVGGVRLHGRKGLSFVTGGVAVYLNYNLVNRASPSDRNGNREIEIFLEGVDTPLTLQFESRKQYEAVSRLLELRISSGRRGYLDQT